MRVLFLPFEWALSVFRSPAHNSHDISHREGGLTATLGRWLKTLIGLVLAPVLFILRIPLVLARNLSSAKGRDLLFATPAVAMFCFLGFVFFQVSSGEGSIADRYRQGAYAALQAEDLELAKTYFTRMRNDGELSQADQLNWAIVLTATGDSQDATKVIDRLAPDEGPAGFGPAHRAKVLSLSQSMANSRDPSFLRRLKRHLDNCDDNSLEINRIWIAYYIAVNDTAGALEKLRLVAEKDPKYWLAVADLHQGKGETSKREKALVQAEAEYKKRVEENPFDADSRIFLAKVFARLDRWDEAERLLLEGVKLEPNDEMKRAAASFYILQYDMESSAAGGVERKFQILHKAIRLDPRYAAAYDRLTRMFIEQGSPEQREAIKNSLMNIVTEGSNSALPHFVLSNLFQAEGDQEKAQWHLERAFELDNNTTSIINNLAWSLAHRKEPNLDRALELAKIAIEKAPHVPDFLDTHGTVLRLRKDFRGAIESFEKALPNSREKDKIHEKLAECYRAIGREDFAKMHEEKAKSAK